MTEMDNSNNSADSKRMEDLNNLPIMDPTTFKALPASLQGRMLEMFKDLVPKSLELISGHLEADDLNAFSEESHKLKGYALQLGLTRLSALSNTLQNESATMPREELDTLVARLSKIFDESVEAIKSCL